MTSDVHNTVWEDDQASYFQPHKFTYNISTLVYCLHLDERVVRSDEGGVLVHQVGVLGAARATKVLDLPMAGTAGGGAGEHGDRKRRALPRG